jgi:hypothetical protein
MRNFFLPLLAALPGAALAQAAGAPLPEAGAGLLQVFLGLGVVIAALIGGLWLLKRVSAPRGAAAGALRVIAGAAVGAARARRAGGDRRDLAGGGRRAGTGERPAPDAARPDRRRRRPCPPARTSAPG